MQTRDETRPIGSETKLAMISPNKIQVQPIEILTPSKKQEKPIKFMKNSKLIPEVNTDNVKIRKSHYKNDNMQPSQFIRKHKDILKTEMTEDRRYYMNEKHGVKQQNVLRMNPIRDSMMVQQDCKSDFKKKF